MALPETALSLYVHIPFCTDKCLYCDFFSVPRGGVPSAVVQRVVEETVLQATRFLDAPGKSDRVETLFLGGGTPSCLPPAQLDRLFESFAPLRCGEWTVEANPETLTESFLDSCARAGVTRLSLGIQSLNTRHLSLLRRRATREHGLAAIRLLKSRWRGELNLDFITGIPGQGIADVREDLSVIGDGWPQHVSLYQLTLEPGTPLEAMVENAEITLNRAEHDEDLWLFGRDELMRRGYIQYEVSNFCLPGRECRHNLRYWRIDPYAGAGPASVSTLPAEWAARAAGRPELAEKDQAVIRFSAPKDISAFLGGASRFWGMETEVISPIDFLLENLMMGLRLARGIEESTLRSRFGRSFSELFPGVWEGWVNRGLALPADGTLRLSVSGLLVLDRLLGELFEKSRETPPGQLPVHWPP